MMHLATVRACVTASAVASVLLVTGCSSNGGVSGAGGSKSGVGNVPGQVVRPTQSPCPKASGKGFSWPTEVPADVPQPPGAHLENVSRTPDGLTIVRFGTPQSLQEAVLFVVHEVQSAGFTLGRGDAEPAEADAPFGRGDLRGVYKMLAQAQCQTEWLVAVTRTRPTTTSPLLPTPSRGPSSQPLPFG